MSGGVGSPIHDSLRALETPISDLRNMTRVTAYVAEHVLQNARDYAKLLKLTGYHALPPDHAELLSFCVYTTEDMASDVEKRLEEAWDKMRATAPKID